MTIVDNGVSGGEGTKSRWAGMARAPARAPLHSVNSDADKGDGDAGEKSFLARVLGGAKNWAAPKA